jgi:predicted dehydrogenase
MNPNLPVHDSSDFSDSRRRFLAGAAATAAGAMAISALASSSAKASPLAWKPQQPAPKAKPRVAVKDGEKLRIGIIGIGGTPGACAMGLGHCEAIANINKKNREKVEIVAVCDLNSKYLEQGKSKLESWQPGVKVDTYRKSAELLARNDIHGVLIATPEHSHSANSIEAIAAGKDIYLEKPMCLNLAMAMELYHVAQANPDTIIQIGTQNTRYPKYESARKLIKEGAIGVPTSSQTSYCRNVKDGEWHYGYDKNWKPGDDVDWQAWCAPLTGGNTPPWDPKVFSQWRRYRKWSTGIIGDLLVHQMTPLMYALDAGWPTRVVATGGHLYDKEMENHDNIHIAVQFESGHQMLVMGSTCNESGLDIAIRGTKANLHLGSRHCELVPERAYHEEIEARKIDAPDIGDPQDAHRVGWLQSIRTREKPPSSVELGTKVMVVVDLATRSMWEGGAFTFDPKSLATTKV